MTRAEFEREKRGKNMRINEVKEMYVFMANGEK